MDMLKNIKMALTEDHLEQTFPLLLLMCTLITEKCLNHCEIAFHHLNVTSQIRVI